MSEPEPAPCLNCGVDLTGVYCAACGQKDVDLERGFWQVVASAVGEAFEADGRLHRTLVPFLLQPGELPRRWAAGQRASVTSPVRLFVFALFAGFVGLQLTGEGWTEFVPEQPMAFDENGHAQLDIDGDSTFQFDLQTSEGNQVLPLSQRAFMQDVLERMVDNGPTAVALMVPLFALALQVVLWRRRLVDHLVFSLIHHSRLLLLAGLTLPLLSRLAIPIVWVVVNIYATLALRRAYDLSVWSTAWRAVLLIFGHTLALLTLLVGILAWSAVAVIEETGSASELKGLTFEYDEDEGAAEPKPPPGDDDGIQPAEPAHTP